MEQKWPPCGAVPMPEERLHKQGEKKKERRIFSCCCSYQCDEPIPTFPVGRPSKHRPLLSDVSFCFNYHESSAFSYCFEPLSPLPTKLDSFPLSFSWRRWRSRMRPGFSTHLKESTCLLGMGRYSHSIVAGGLLLMSYTTRLMPLTELMISLDTEAKKS